ncbi:hypothetical protein JTB14_035398 [Gonioctena quinquepunctata]|nr:hypothetical protein JTB14_035398 [Gonioctena quinquepunctata]
MPIMVMPQFGDQFTNAKALESVGGGIIFNFNEATEENVQEALERLLSPELKESMAALSKRYQDRPLSPIDTAIYWIEYVARHKGAPHMRTAAVDMPFYKYLLLDVIAFLIFILFSLSYFVYFLVRFVLRMVCRTRYKVKQN